MLRFRHIKVFFTSFISVFFLTACGGDGGSSNGGGNASNMARFTYDCDLQGVIGSMILDAEAVGSTGIVFGSGPNPDITGVIGTGNYTLYTSGEVVSNVARYIFTGENQFADFTNTATFERFRVQWVSQDDDLIMVVNPFGPGPAQHFCQFTGASYL
jgi:hypothetical protein